MTHMLILSLAGSRAILFKIALGQVVNLPAGG